MALKLPIFPSMMSHANREYLTNTNNLSVTFLFICCHHSIGYISLSHGTIGNGTHNCTNNLVSPTSNILFPSSIISFLNFQNYKFFSFFLYFLFFYFFFFFYFLSFLNSLFFYFFYFSDFSDFFPYSDVKHICISQ